MATPTWRNVSTGGDGGAANALEGATRTFDRAFSSLQEIGNRAVEDARFNQARNDQLEQQQFKNNLATNQDARAAEQLLLDKAAGKRAETRLQDDLLTTDLNRKLSNSAESRTQYRYSREVLENNRADTRQANLEKAFDGLDAVLQNSDAESLSRNLVQYARENNIDDQDLIPFLQQAQGIDQALYGLTDTQNAVINEQKQNDAAQIASFEERSNRQLETVAAGSGVSPTILDLQRDTESAQGLVTELNKASGGEATDMYQYFNQKFKRVPTRAEFEYLVGIVAESDLTGDGVDIDSWTVTRDGYKRVINEYADSIGVGTSEAAKKNREALNAWYELRNNQASVLERLRKTQADNQAKLLKQARGNNQSRVAGNNEVESILATPVQSEALKMFNQKLDEATKKASGARPEFQLPVYNSIGNYDD